MASLLDLLLGGQQPPAPVVDMAPPVPPGVPVNMKGGVNGSALGLLPDTIGAMPTPPAVAGRAMAGPAAGNVPQQPKTIGQLAAQLDGGQAVQRNPYEVPSILDLAFGKKTPQEFDWLGFAKGALRRYRAASAIDGVASSAQNSIANQQKLAVEWDANRRKSLAEQAKRQQIQDMLAKAGLDPSLAGVFAVGGEDALNAMTKAKAAEQFSKTIGDPSTPLGKVFATLGPAEQAAVREAGPGKGAQLLQKISSDAKKNKVDMAKVQSSVALPGGGWRYIMNDGTSRVVDGGGKELSGKDAEAFIQAAEARGVDLQGQRASSRAGGANAQKVALESFQTMGKVQQNISNLKEGLRAIEKGADTGVITRMLPSVTSASIELDNVRNRLGLDIIGAVTFGALSEGELKLALDTAMPTNLDPGALAQWLRRKIEAQEKAYAALNNAAIYLSKPGNTIATWLESKQVNQGGGQPRPAAPQTQMPSGFTLIAD